MKTMRRHVLMMTALLAALGLAGVAEAVTSVRGGNWSDAGTWGGSVPGIGADVIVATGHSVTVDVATATMNTFTGDGTVVFTGWNNTLTAAEVTLNSTVTHLDQSDIVGTPGVYADWTPDNRVWIACSNLTVNGSIHADHRGYQPNTTIYRSGRGPGGGPYTASSSAQGAGHGGAAARGRDGPGGVAYGSLNEPTDPGSSGGTGYLGTGGKGGGAVRIDATGAVVVNGSITVDGQVSGSNHSGGGSGGSIYIACATIGGSGTLSARGGNVSGAVNGESSAGAGGRIVVAYQSSLQAAAPASGVTIRAAAGIYSKLGNRSSDGTLPLSDTLLFKAQLTDAFQGVRIHGVTAFSTNAAVSLNNAAITFVESGFLLDVGALTINNGRLEATAQTVDIAGALTLQNNATLYLNAPVTNDNLWPYTCEVTVGGALATGAGCWIYPTSHPTNGASVRFGAASVFLAANSGFNAVGLGYRGGRFSGERGYGPGGTVVGNNSTSGGAGYGGRGGDSRRASSTGTGFGGPAYGSISSPDAPGSGGGAGWSAHVGGDGGGLVRIEAAGTVTVNGLIDASGTYSGSTHSGGGSGGGVYIACEVFAGTGGVIRANGGNSGTDGDGAPGGGGRIAVAYNGTAQSNAPLPTVVFQAASGTGHARTLSYNNIPIAQPEAGTLSLPDTRLLGSTITDTVRDAHLYGCTSWTTPTLTVSNAFVAFAEPGFQLTVAGDVVVNGSKAALSLTNNALLTVGGNTVLTNGAAFHGQSVSSAGNLWVASGGRFHTYAFATNGVGPDYGGLIQFAGSAVIASNAWIVPVSHPTNGASTLFRVGSLSLAGGSGGGIDARGRGFQGGRWFGGAALAAGRGPGGGGAAPGNSGAGGGYGGVGGKARAVAGGGTYGSALEPTQPGSGGGRCSSFNGGDGGGLARFEIARNAVIDGVIDARGTHVFYDHDGGGSGGGIYLRCRRISGAGALLADGGGMTGVNGGNGGGGRIAVWHIKGQNTFTGTTSVSPTYTVTPGYTPLPGTGTVHWVEMPASGTLIQIR